MVLDSSPIFSEKPISLWSQRYAILFSHLAISFPISKKFKFRYDFCCLHKKLEIEKIVRAVLNVFLVVVAVPSFVFWNPFERSTACWAKWLS
jgi:hypothetical protein